METRMKRKMRSATPDELTTDLEAREADVMADMDAAAAMVQRAHHNAEEYRDYLTAMAAAYRRVSDRVNTLISTQAPEG